MPMQNSTAESPPSALLPSRAALATLLDGVDEPLLLFDDLGRLSFCNRAAMRALGAEPASGVHLAACWAPRRGLAAPSPCGRSAQAPPAAPDAGRWPRRALVVLAYRARPGTARADRGGRSRLPAALPEVEAGPTLEMLRMLWASPFPATLQDAQFRLVAVNDAFLASPAARARR